MPMGLPLLEFVNCEEDKQVEITGSRKAFYLLIFFTFSWTMAPKCNGCVTLATRSVNANVLRINPLILWHSQSRRSIWIVCVQDRDRPKKRWVALGWIAVRCRRYRSQKPDPSAQLETTCTNGWKISVLASPRGKVDQHSYQASRRAESCVGRPVRYLAGSRESNDILFSRVHHHPGGKRYLHVSDE